MKSTLKNHTYQCKCGALTKELVWDKELPTAQFKCIECGKVLNSDNLLTVSKAQVTSIRTPTKNR
jgi:predicted SprT family Zn-dependent metalloprotease